VVYIFNSNLLNIFFKIVGLRAWTSKGSQLDFSAIQGQKFPNINNSTE
jgi:hypothetical protein